MSSPHLPVLRPLREQGLSTPDAVAASAAASRMGQVIRRMGGPPVLPAVRHDAILRRLLRADDRGHERRFALARPALAMGIVLAVALLGIGAHAAISWVRWGSLPWTHEPAAAGPAPAPRTAARAGARRAARLDAPDIEIDRDLVGPEAVAAPEALAAAAPPAQRPRVRAGASGPTPPALPPPPEQPSSLAQESRMLGEALTQIRTGRDYARALAILRDYDARFPNGTLRGEAALAELDALLALSQSESALALLEEREIHGPRAAEVLVVRGELRAGARRCRDAIADFDRVLARPVPRRLEERALYGRASCRAQTGDAAGSASDLDAYLSRFPDGPRAAELRRKSNR